MGNIRNIRIIAISVVFFCIYFVTILFHFEFWSDLFSSIVSLVATGMLFSCFLDKSTTKSSKLTFLNYSLACLFWTIADIAWAIYAVTPGLDPEESVLIIYFYAFTNVFLLVGTLIYAIQIFKKWNVIQLIVDTLAVSTTCIMLFWIIFLNKNTSMIETILKDDWTSSIMIIIDILIFAGIAIWFLSVCKRKTPTYIHISSIGIIAFVITDLYYYYIYYNNLYRANTFVDAIYMGALLCIAIGGMCGKSYRNLNHFEEIEFSQKMFLEKSIVFLVGPILFFLAEGFVLVDLLIYTFIFLIHQSFSTYIQSSVQNEKLLKKEKEMNHILEEEISKRTKEIVEKSRELEESNKELDFLSKQDTVTNLYNRRYFIEKLEEELAHIHSTETLALLFLDVDRFKTINDTYGHHIGDQLLIELASRLKDIECNNCMLARLGGDEFVIGIHGENNYNQLEKIANRIISKCSKRIEIDQYVFHVGISIGISVFPLDASDAHTLMKNADIAMYQAKAFGRGQCVSYDSVFTNILQRKNEIEILLRKADFDNEFEVFYQPQFRIPDNTLIGVEALIRWKNPLTGYISPSEFIPIAEEIDYINPIGEWVLKQSIHQIGVWNTGYSQKLKVGINVSPKQLDNKYFIPLLIKTMKNNHVPSNYIDIEITESIAIEGEYRIKQIDSLFKGLGISISIDDFGTGYSSLSYLKFFPFERIKIAKPLIDAISTINFDLQIVKSTIMLAKSLGIKTIAEGVETIDQYKILVELGCDEIQGYFLGKPMPAAVFEEQYLKNPSEINLNS